MVGIPVMKELMKTVCLLLVKVLVSHILCSNNFIVNFGWEHPYHQTWHDRRKINDHDNQLSILHRLPKILYFQLRS